LVRQTHGLDIVRVQDVELSGANDPAVLEWAARETRILLTNDVSTTTKYAYDRVRDGLPMPGVIEIGPRVRIGQAIADILLLAEQSLDSEWEGQVLYLPLE
jgi:hypothetical protein